MNSQFVLLFFKNPYATGFLFFWLLILVSCVVLWGLESVNRLATKNIEYSLFWLFGFFMLAFMVMRPIGIARDDMPYTWFFNDICPTLSCGKILQGESDIAWFSLVGFLKSLLPNPRVMLWLGAFALLLKLTLIFILTKRPLFALILYFGLYYQVHDLTAWRISLALAFFMLAIWLVVRSRHYWNAWFFFVCVFFHRQAMVAPLILLGIFLNRHRQLFVFLCLIAVILLLMHIYPSINFFAKQIEGDFGQLSLIQSFKLYVEGASSLDNLVFRPAPIVVFPQILLTIWLLYRADTINERLDAMLMGCVCLGCFFLWFFASLPDVQVRFFEFFMVPTVLLAGIRRLSGFEFAGVVFVSGLVVVKYNIVHQLIIQS